MRPYCKLGGGINPCKEAIYASFRPFEKRDGRTQGIEGFGEPQDIEENALQAREDRIRGSGTDSLTGNWPAPGQEDNQETYFRPRSPPLRPGGPGPRDGEGPKMGRGQSWSARSRCVNQGNVTVIPITRIPSHQYTINTHHEHEWGWMGKRGGGKLGRKV